MRAEVILSRLSAYVLRTRWLLSFSRAAAIYLYASIQGQLGGLGSRWDEGAKWTNPQISVFCMLHLI